MRTLRPHVHATELPAPDATVVRTGRRGALTVIPIDEEPVAPGLPRLRYRLPLPPGSRDKVTAAIRQYLPPHLWWGEEQRAPGHLGRPDMSRRPRL
ncbi:hypothetical protein ACGFWI_08165 [Streptomyces sp. NPDC048434]|uniref:hypothetical protein n=1 Tax=Streptomyces sp. NPDC048434 TaxID=3365549 RepID=UPI0037225150